MKASIKNHQMIIPQASLQPAYVYNLTLCASWKLTKRIETNY